VIIKDNNHSVSKLLYLSSLRNFLAATTIDINFPQASRSQHSGMVQTDWKDCSNVAIIFLGANNPNQNEARKLFFAQPTLFITVWRIK
jgi:hypothetical protein